MKIKFGINEIEKIVKEHLLPKLNVCKVFAFEGSLGAGKTTTIKMFLKACGVHEVVTSPTFNYVNTYHTKDGKVFHHFDLYRLPDLQAFFDAGFDDFFYHENNEMMHGNNCWVIIEWPEVSRPFLNSEQIKDLVCGVSLNHIKDDPEHRIIEICAAEK